MEKVFADVVELNILRWRNYPVLSGWSLNANISVLIRGRQRKITDRRGEGNVTTEVENGVRRPQAKEWWQPLGSGKKQEQILPESHYCPCLRLDFSDTDFRFLASRL